MIASARDRHRDVISFQDAELDVRREWRVEDASAFELQTRAELAEQGSARSKDDGGDVDLQLVDQVSLQRLLGDAGAAADADLSVAGDLPGPVDGGLDAVDELEAGRGLGLIDESVGDDDARDSEGRPTAPAVSDVVHPAPYDGGTGLHQLVDHLAVDARGARPILVRFSICPRPTKDPVVQAFAVVTEPTTGPIVGCGHEPVERHR